MTAYSFTIVLDDTDGIVDDMTQESFLNMSDALCDAGCDDGSPGLSGGEVSIDFLREAESLRDAIESAMTDISRAGYCVSRVEPGERDVFDQINALLAGPSAS